MSDAPSFPSDLSPDEMADYLRLYLDETDELLDALVETMLALEADPANMAGLDEAFRLPSLAAATVGFISNGKQGTKEFLDALEAELVARFGVAEVVRTVKANVSAPAEPAILDRARQWHALVAAVGD